MRWFAKRTYKTGTRWCFWRWTFVDSDYITRLHVLKTPWFALCLHWINKPDPEPYLHDHPVSFLSLILRGWYEEHRGEHRRVVRHSWWNRVRATDKHTICEVSPGGALTLCLMGPKVREWGFHDVQLFDGRLVRHAGAWLYWKDYHHAQRALAKLVEMRSSVKPVTIDWETAKRKACIEEMVTCECNLDYIEDEGDGGGHAPFCPARKIYIQHNEVQP